MSVKQNNIVIFGTTWCPDCKRSKQFLGDHREKYEWDEGAMAALMICQYSQSIAEI